MKRPLALLISTGVATFTLVTALAVAAPRLGSAPATPLGGAEAAGTTGPNVIFMTATPPPTVQVQAGGDDDGFAGSYDDDGEEYEDRYEDGEREGAEVEFAGRVEAMTAQSWVVGGQTVWLTERTEIKRGIQIGDFVKVHAITGEDGTLLAREIEIED